MALNLLAEGLELVDKADSKHIFSVQIFRLEILDYLSRRSVYFANFPVGQAKIVLHLYHLHSDRNFGNLLSER